jgi:hypothetical protein
MSKTPTTTKGQTMNTKTATVYMEQDNAAKAAKIVYLSIVADGQLVDQLTIADGGHLARRADAALKTKGFFRSTGFNAVNGDLVASVIY